ncbi:hypothetical protein [Neobacillus sp. FSL H8-0543]|uniref:hypothetical protein n=1 Tax=Neobacillus sp. FSL H8-0543 TaxID=2954672 RepID=UPI00315968C1
MRATRRRKYRKTHFSIKLIWHIGLVWCLILMVCINLPLNTTTALFTDRIQHESTVKAGTWWDGSKLSFTSKDKDNNVETESPNVAEKQVDQSEKDGAKPADESMVESKSDTDKNTTQQSDTVQSEENTPLNPIENNDQTIQENQETQP